MAPLGRRDSSHTANGRVPRGEDGAHWTPLYQLTQRPAGGRLTQDAIRGATLLFLVVAVIPSRSSVQLTVTHRLQHTSFPCLSRSPGVSHTHVPRVDDAIQPLYPLLPPSPLALNLCQLQIFSSEMTFHIRWPKYWSFSYSISPSNEYSGLISFSIDWFDLLAVQGTLKGLLQCHNLKASILLRSDFFMIQLSHPYMTTGKTTTLTRWTFVGKVMPLLFNMLSRWS